MNALECSAVLLAAGRSTRMGRDKALLEAGGNPLWRRQRELLAQAGAAEIFLSARPEQEWARAAAGFTAVLPDAFPDCGPISGIIAGLERATLPHLLVLAIDLPQLTSDWFRRLQRECAQGIGAAGRHEGRYEPLAAIYPRALLPLAWEAFAAGQYGLQPLIARAVKDGGMRPIEITPEDRKLFENWNERGSD